MKKIEKIAFTSLAVLSSVLIGGSNSAHAQSGTGSITSGSGGVSSTGLNTGSIPSNSNNDLNGFLDQISAILRKAIEIIMGLAVVVFLWGVVMYIISKSPEEQAKAKGYMIWGIIGLFVMVSIWALVGLLTGTFFGGAIRQTPPAIPTL
ncbi:hypothetical protein H6775_03565 [Candidatus Nomurabacteria bacterium]|nr:hypothetical protein [Candidatus Nomurabacteria bacterium]